MKDEELITNLEFYGSFLWDALVRLAASRLRELTVDKLASKLAEDAKDEYFERGHQHAADAGTMLIGIIERYVVAARAQGRREGEMGERERCKASVLEALSTVPDQAARLIAIEAIDSLTPNEGSRT